MQDPFADAVLSDDDDGEFHIAGAGPGLTAEFLEADEPLGCRWAPRGAPRGADPLGKKRKRLSAQEQSIRKLFPVRKYHIKFQAVQEYKGSAL